MSKLIFLVSIITWLNTNDKSQTHDDRTPLLTGTTSKSWYLYARTPDSEDATCMASSSISLDNTYTFFANGTFEFDHGAVTEDPACDGEDCCSDFVNLTGTWQFTNNQDGLRIMAHHETGNVANAVDMVLYDVPIAQMDNDTFTLTHTDTETNTVYSFEFRKR